MAKKIQKKQIEDGVFVETKATYSAPTQDNEFVQKKYVDTEVAKKANVAHTHNWGDILSKPTIQKSGNTYNIPGIGGNIEIPASAQLPSWVTQTKPTYDWTEIQNRPALNYLPLNGGVLSPENVVWYDGLKIDKSTAGWSTFLLGSNSILDDTSWMIARNPQGQLMIQSTDNGLDTGLLLSNDFLKWKGLTFSVDKEGAVHANKMFDAPILRVHTPETDWVSLNSKGGKLNVKVGNADRDSGEFKPVLASGYEVDGKNNNFVLLAGGGTKELSEISLWIKQNNTLYGDYINSSINTVVTKRIIVENFPNTARFQLSSNEGEMFVTIENPNVFVPVRAAGFKIANKDDNSIVLAGGGSIKKKDLIAKVIHINSATFNITPEVVGNTGHVATNCVLNFNQMPELSTFAIRKVYDGGSVTFYGNIPPIYTGDTVLNGKKGSTAIIDYGLNNQIFIDIRNI